MSLQPVSIYIVPEQTARVAHAAFPQSSLCMGLYDQFGTIFQDQDFADLFPESGQPGLSPFRLALVTILQFLEGLSDRKAADAVRGLIDWKYCVLSVTSLDLSHALPADLFRHHARSPKGYILSDLKLRPHQLASEPILHSHQLFRFCVSAGNLKQG